MLSWKRTVLLPPVGVEVPLTLRRDFLAGGCRLDEEGRGGLVEVLLAWAKSSARAGSFGCVRVELLLGAEKPWNWDVRSSNCFWRPGRESEIVAALLYRGNGSS